MEQTRFDLSRKTILVTGASSGIGQQTAIELTKMGANVIITGRNEKNLNKTLNLCIGENNKAIIADLTNNSQIEKLVEDIDKLDGIFHSAGVADWLMSRFINSDNIYEMMDINFKAPVLITSLLLRKKKINKNASLIFVSTISTVHTNIGSSLYASSKSALEAYVKTLALEVAPKGIRANCILPSLVNTPMIEEPKESYKNNYIKVPENLLYLGIGEPTDIANMAIFLFSDAGKWITGQNIRMGAI